MRERADRERIEKDFQDAIEMQKENERVLTEKISVLETTHTNQVKDLGDKLNNAQQAAQAAHEAAAVAQAQIAALQQSGGKDGCNIL